VALDLTARGLADPTSEGPLEPLLEWHSFSADATRENLSDNSSTALHLLTNVSEISYFSRIRDPNPDAIGLAPDQGYRVVGTHVVAPDNRSCSLTAALVGASQTLAQSADGRSPCESQ
jgi:hypothetical protein